jgi:hypothetical protein
VATETFAHGHTELVAQFVSQLSTRTLNRFAEESRLDGESLKDAVDRYEIDYAWHILGSDRMREASVAVLEAGLPQSVTDEHRDIVAAILRSAAEKLAPDVLMSFDNDVPEQLGRLLLAWFEGHPVPAVEAAC